MAREDYHDGGMRQSYHAHLSIRIKKTASLKYPTAFRAWMSCMRNICQLYRHCYSPLTKICQFGNNGHDVLLTTFGDMMRVPGSSSSLERKGLKVLQITVVYSTLDALHLAEKHPDKKVVFLAVGFETTAPTIAASVIEAERRGLKTTFVLTAHSNATGYEGAPDR